MKHYEFLDHTADVAFVAVGETIEDVFQQSALATFDTMTDLKKVEHIECKEIKLENKEMDKLLFDFLSELVFLKDCESMLFSKFDIVIHEGKLHATIHGEVIDQEKHEQKVDVKAVTYHEFSLKQENNVWRAHVILDI